MLCFASPRPHVERPADHTSLLQQLIPPARGKGFDTDLFLRRDAALAPLSSVNRFGRLEIASKRSLSLTRTVSRADRANPRPRSA